MSCFLYENHRGSPTLTLLNVLGMLGVLNVLHVLNMPMDTSLACWALLSLVMEKNLKAIPLRSITNHSWWSRGLAEAASWSIWTCNNLDDVHSPWYTKKIPPRKNSLWRVKRLAPWNWRPDELMLRYLEMTATCIFHINVNISHRKRTFYRSMYVIHD